MGVIIGSCFENGVPCVEGPDSPELTISNPLIHKTTAATGDGRWGYYADISMVRDVAIKRKFFLKKVDIPAVTAWLASLNGKSTEYNVGTASKKTVAGVFNLDEQFTFSPISPQLSSVEVTFTGQVLDCNFLLPSGLTFVKSSTRKCDVMLGTTKIKTYESSTDGDGTGIEVRAGPVMMWDEVPYPAYKSLAPATTDIPATASEIAASLDAQYEMAAYREIYLAINGEKIQSWYIPSLRPKRRKYFMAERIYYGATKAEYAAAGNAMPTLTENVNLETGSERLSGLYFSERITKTAVVDPPTSHDPIYTWNETSRTWEFQAYDPTKKQTLTFQIWHRTPTEPPRGFFHANLCTESLQATGAWSPAMEWRVEWPEEPIKYYDGAAEKSLYLEPNPHPYYYYALIGYAFMPHESWGPWNTPTAVVALYWTTVSSTRVRLMARGSDGQEHILLDWASS